MVANEYFKNPTYAAEFINLIQKREVTKEQIQFFYDRLLPKGEEYFTGFITEFIKKTEEFVPANENTFDDILELKREEYMKILVPMAEVCPSNLSVEAYFHITVFNTFVLDNIDLGFNEKLEMLNRIEEIVEAEEAEGRLIERDILSEYYSYYLSCILSVNDLDINLMNKINEKLKKVRTYHKLEDFI